MCDFWAIFDIFWTKFGNAHHSDSLTIGQLISEWYFGVFKYPLKYTFFWQPLKLVKSKKIIPTLKSGINVPLCLLIFWLFQGLQPYSWLHRAYLNSISIRCAYSFLPNFPRATFIQGGKFIQDSRVITSIMSWVPLFFDLTPFIGLGRTLSKEVSLFERFEDTKSSFWE